jgi:hypothetical protein
MAQYALLRFAKHKGGAAGGLEAHHERTKEKYASNPDIDTARSRYNFHIVKPQGSYKREVDGRIKQAGCRTRKDSTRFVDTMITASHNFFKGKTLGEAQAYFKHAASFIAQRVGGHNIVSAVVHLDEKTPHMHLTFVPLTADNRLSAKEILGNRADLSRWQDDFHAHMVKKWPDFERGERSRETGRRHIPMRVFKQAISLEKQAAKIAALLSEKNPLTMRKSRDEAQALLTKMWPKMAAFQGELKKYKGTIEYLQGQNTELAEIAEANRDNTMENRIKAAALQSRVRELERFKAAVPEDVRRQAEASMRRGTKDRTR